MLLNLSLYSGKCRDSFADKEKTSHKKHSQKIETASWFVIYKAFHTRQNCLGFQITFNGIKSTFPIESQWFLLAGQVCVLCQYLSLIFEVDCENIFLVILFESVWRRWKAADDTTKIIQLHLVSTMPGSRLQPLLQLCDAAYNSLNTTQIWLGSPAEFRNPNPWFMMLAVSEAGEVRDIWREYRVRPALRQPTVQKARSNL